MNHSTSGKKGLTDYSTVIGLCAGAGFLLWAVIPSGGWSAFVHVPSIALVIGGSICAALISTPSSRVREIWPLMRLCFRDHSESAQQTIARLVQLSETARRDGILALEQKSRACNDSFLKAGLQMTVDGVDPEQIQSILSAELDALEARHAAGRNLFENLGRFAPAFGMIGTLIGMVIMLRDLSQPAGIGPAMAGALLTTLYGAVLANVFALPLANKLARLTRDEVIRKSMVVRGLLAIQRGDNPGLVESKLNTFLPANHRKNIHRQAA